MKHPLARLSAPLCLLVFCAAVPVAAQDDRTRYPEWLARGVMEMTVGEIRYPFSGHQLESGFEAESIDTPKLAARLSLGHRLTDHLSLNLSYMRPARWVRYQNVNGDRSAHSVWLNIVGASMKQRLPMGRVALYGEGGVGVITRHGVEINDAVVIDDLVYAAPLFGAGTEVRLNNAWGVTAGATFLPGRTGEEHPYTMFFSSGVTYRVQPRPATSSARPANQAPVFPEHLIQFGVSTNGAGDPLGTVVSPVFWEGDAVVQTGASLDYQRNVFHTKTLFSVDLGASLAYGHSRERGDDFMTLSLFPLMRFTPVRTATADLYVSYSVAGPTVISKFIIDGLETGRHFTFRDAIGVGAYLGKGKHVNAEIKIVHYSNGNLLPRNSGIQVPFTFDIGYAF